MKKLKLLIAILGLPCFLASQNYVNRVLEYKPAPGQHINIESIGTPQAAENMPVEINNMVSLGSFGGYIVLGFENACINSPQNPYGVDFTIFGNAFEDSSEPGVVWVMKDENENGKADDTWYEIKGSQHFQSQTNENYKITYFKTESRDILWKDNLGNSGILKANSYNLQEYYPTPDNFPNYSQDSILFQGTLLAPAIDSSNPIQFVMKALDFGYADVHPRKQGVDLNVPDNPYTSEVEGAGGDPIDISWAVDAGGNYVNLDSIHFVKIVSGNLASIGWLGEVSTDVAYVTDVNENSEITGDDELLVLYHHQPKIVAGETLQLEAAFFKKGRIQEASFLYTSEDSNVASVNASGLITANNIGLTKISVSSNDKIKTALISVIAPDSIEILSDFSSVYVGDTILLKANVFDNNGDKINTQIEFENNTPALGKIIDFNGNIYFIAENTGDVSITFSVDGFSEKTESFRIWSESDLVHAFLTIKTENENLFPLQQIEVGLTNLNGFVQNRENDYSGLDRHTLAHALVSGLQKAGFEFFLRDDSNSNGELYLYSLENQGEFTYGWGGKESPEAFAKAWIAKINSKQYLNNFDEIEISEGDTVVLYHVPDIINPWNFTRMKSDKDSAVVNEEITITLNQSTCTFSEGIISETSLTPIQNREIFANGKSYFSDENGQATILLETSPPLVVSSGTDAVLISKKIVTSIGNQVMSTIKVFPNPAENELVVNGYDLEDSHLYIFDLNGRNIWAETANTSKKYINVQSFIPGFYTLKIVGISGVKTFKFIKK